MTCLVSRVVSSGWGQDRWSSQNTGPPRKAGNRCIRGGSPWGNPPGGGGNGSGRGPTPPDIDEIVKKIQEFLNKYLPELANGTKIPCFGLTGPHNGSDATGSIDTGFIFKNSDGKLQIKLTINKRYITLAPVANLIGLAFNLKDPYNLLENQKQGITVALLERGHPGLKQETYHNPLDVGFPNGTLKGELIIDLDQVIGGENISFGNSL